MHHAKKVSLSPPARLTGRLLRRMSVFAACILLGLSIVSILLIKVTIIRVDSSSWALGYMDVVVANKSQQRWPSDPAVVRGGGENAAETTTPTTLKDARADDDDDPDKDCPFRESPIYRKVFVYPDYGDVANGWSGDILSEKGKNYRSLLPRWPWLDMDDTARQNATGHYNSTGDNVQYTTELLVRELMVNPRSCLRTYYPEDAVLFYVPYLPSIEHHLGHNFKTNFSTSLYGQAILDILDHSNYTAWESTTFGLTSKYWKRRQGADHILVFSEPLHGLYHPKRPRGSFHYIYTQNQLLSPIIISVEQSTAFVQQYPKCSAKNILLPYPNADGKWYNGKYQLDAQERCQRANVTTLSSDAALSAEQTLARHENTTFATSARPVAQFLAVGLHGTCRNLRKAMTLDYRNCAPSYATLKQPLLQAHHYTLAMRLATFCSAPGGDSPSSKRPFDALLAGCIPVILSHDFVWPFTKEWNTSLDWDPDDFSVRLNAADYDSPLLHRTSCKPIDAASPGLQAYLESIPADDILRLRRGMEKAKHMYSWYRDNVHLPDNPLRKRVLPDGGVAHMLVHMLAERAEGKLWLACQEELKLPRQKADPKQFQC